MKQRIRCALCCVRYQSLRVLVMLVSTLPVRRTERFKGKEDFTEEQYEHMHQMFELTDDALTQMNKILVGHRQDNDVNRSFNIENEINNYSKPNCVHRISMT